MVATALYMGGLSWHTFDSMRTKLRGSQTRKRSEKGEKEVSFVLLLEVDEVSRILTRGMSPRESGQWQRCKLEKEKKPCCIM